MRFNMNVVIAGSRSLTDYKLLVEEVDKCIDVYSREAPEKTNDY